MGIQKLGHIMVKRLQARPYSSQARVPIPPPPPASAITQIREGIAATSITWCLFAPVCWGLMYWFDVHEMRTMCNALKDYEKEFERTIYKYCNKAYRMELKERRKELVERRAEAERRDREAFEDLLRLGRES